MAAHWCRSSVDECISDFALVTGAHRDTYALLTSNSSARCSMTKPLSQRCWIACYLVDTFSNPNRAVGGLKQQSCRRPMKINSENDDGRKASGGFATFDSETFLGRGLSMGIRRALLNIRSASTNQNPRQSDATPEGSNRCGPSRTLASPPIPPIITHLWMFTLCIVLLSVGE